jgi:outer membrane protein assembly factor BamB
VYCLDFGTGKQLWRHSYPCQAGLYPGPRATPLAADGAVYTLSRNGLALCMDANSGKVIWQRDLPRDANVVVPRWGLGTSLVPEGGWLLLNAGRHGMALERRTGATVWQSPRALCGYASPVLLDANGERRMVCFGQQAVYGVGVKTGRLLWSHPWVSRLDEHSSDPVVWKEQVFVTSVYGKGCAMLRTDGNSCRQVWLNQSMACKFSTPYLLDGRLYGVHGNTGAGEGMLRCLDFSDGRTVWEHNLGRLSSLAVAGGRFIILTEAGTVIVARAGAEGYRELARGQVSGLGSDRDKATKGKCWTAPVLCRGRLFIRTDRGDLACVDLG